MQTPEEKDAARLEGATAMVEAIYDFQVKGNRDAPGNPRAVVEAMKKAEGRK